MKVVAVDFGTKRLGVALGVDGRVVSWSTLPVTSEQDALNKLTDLIAQESVGAVVFGLPVRLSGEEKEEAASVRRFAGKLSEQTKVPAVFVDERLTTNEAEALLREQGVSAKTMRGKVDAVVAKLLLEQHFRGQ